jgi:hypothetical protein
MYTILENQKRMTRKEMRKEFPDKWVYVVDCDFELGIPMKTGVPKVIADIPWEGRETGMYRKLDDEYGRTMYMSFLSNEINVFGFSEVKVNV